MFQISSMPSQPGFAEAKFGFKTTNRNFASPYTLQQHKIVGLNPCLFCEFTLPAMSWKEAAYWLKFFIELQQTGKFWASDPWYQPNPEFTDLESQVSVATPVAAGSNWLPLANWPTSGAYTVEPGSYLAVNNELKIVTNLLTADSAEVGFKIFPALRQAVPAGTKINLSHPQGIFLANQNQFVWTTDALLFGTTSFSGLEAIPTQRVET